MKYGTFGATGITVSRLALGSWYLPHEMKADANGIYAVDRKKSESVINRAIELGINFFDTADAYRGVYNRDNFTTDFTNVGLAEQIVGEALSKHDRESLVIVTKETGRTGSLLNDHGNNRKHIRRAIDNSLRRLKTDYIDVYLIHSPDHITSLENAARSMNILIEQGKILHYGLSNFPADQISEMIHVCRESGLEPPSAVQDEYNLLDRTFEKGELGLVEKYNIGAMIYSPLAQGVLAGRYSNKSEGIPRRDYETFFAGKVEGMTENKIVKSVEEISKSKSVSMANISLAWLIHKTKNIFPVVGASNINQLEDNARAVDLELSEEDFKSIELV